MAARKGPQKEQFKKTNSTPINQHSSPTKPRTQPVVVDGDDDHLVRRRRQPVALAELRDARVQRAALGQQLVERACDMVALMGTATDGGAGEADGAVVVHDTVVVWGRW
jgi:hypothetical protein